MQYNLIIVTEPSNFLLDHKILNNITNFLNSNNITIVNKTSLSDQEAYQFTLEFNDKLYDNIYALIKNFIGTFPVDFYLLNQLEAGVKKLLISDMDSTLIKQECIDEIARTIGKYEQMQEITHRSMSGKLLFEESLITRVKLLANIDVTILEEIAHKKIEFSAGALIMAKTLKKLGVITAVASGGFTAFTKIIKEKLNFDYDFANQLEIIDNKLTGNLIMPIYGSKDKLSSLNNLITKHQLTAQDCIAIGDGANDLPMLQALDLGISYHAKDIVKKFIKHQINHTSLTTLLFMQGIKRHDFCI